MTQVDLVLLDFCKGFDKVPHKRPLNILSYEIHSDLIKWIQKCGLTKQNQRVILEHYTSNELLVKSGVPQGTVLRTITVSVTYS